MTYTFRASSLFAVAAIFLTAFVAPSQAANTPQPKIIMIDRMMVLRGSKVGQDIVRQVNAYTSQAENELRGQGAALQNDVKAFQQQSAILSADLKAKKMRDLEARRAGLQAQVQKRQTLIQGGFLKAREQVLTALGPIVQGIMVEKGANILLDRNAVMLGARDLDVTPLAIQRLDQKMPSIKVELVAPPPGVLQQQQQGSPPPQ